MYDTLIKLNSIKELYSFVDILNNHSGTFEIVANDYVVDAKSLMSMLSPVSYTHLTLPTILLV